MQPTGNTIKKSELGEAQKLLAYWQRELRLDQWKIEIGLLAAPEETDGTQSQSIMKKYQRATIILIHPTDKTNWEYVRENLQEVAIVRELLRINETPWHGHPDVIKVLDEDDWLKQLHENSLNIVAEALVRVRRGERR